MTPDHSVQINRESWPPNSKSEPQTKWSQWVYVHVTMTSQRMKIDKKICNKNENRKQTE